MISRRPWLRLIGLLGLLAVALGSYAHHSWTRLLERQQISQLHWQGLQVSTQGLRLERLELRQGPAASGLQLQLEQLQLNWTHWRPSPPFWQQIHIARLRLSLPQPDAAAKLEPRLSLAQLGAALARLPERLRIEQLAVELPCAQRRCTLLGDLQLLNQPASHPTPEQGLRLQLNLAHQQQQLNWTGQWLDLGDSQELQLNLAVDRQPQLRLHSRLQAVPAGLTWQGSLSSNGMNQAALLQSWLKQWLPHSENALPAAPSAAQLQAQWQLQLDPGPLSLKQLQRLSGQIHARAVLPEPWPVPGLGLLQGQFQVAARALEGQWLADSLSAELQLSPNDSPLLQSLPEQLRPRHVQLHLVAAEPLSGLAESLQERALPLAFSLHGQGAGDFDWHGKLALSNGLPWALQLQDATLKFTGPELTLQGQRLSDLRGRLALSGYLDQQQLRLELGPGSRLSVGQVQAGELQLEQLKVSSNALQLAAQLQAGQLQGWQLQGHSHLRLQRLEHPQLKPQSWRWQGQLRANEGQLRLEGSLSNHAELKLKLQLQHSKAEGLHLQAQLAELFLRSGNPLQHSLSAWPALLELNNGRLNASASLRLAPTSSSPTLQLDIKAKGLAGIYDRSELSGLDSALRLQLEPGQLRLELDELQLQQVNPGIALGPLRLRGRYRAPLTSIGTGQLQLDEAHGTLLGGSLRLTPGHWDLSQQPLALPLRVQGLELEQLFALYPTEGLHGSGVLDGLLPLQLDSNGLSVDQGQLTARQPGGVLQFHSERIRALGRSNPAMQLVTQALEDFRYDKLQTKVNYDQHGKLQLGIRLEGQNPAIEQGRPIHFTINLEEDLPTLLASLQLTDKVSEIIRQRVQQQMLKRNAKSAPQEP